MIAYLGELIKQIVLIILIATFLDLLLPNSQMRRYIKLVVGLLIIMTILSPVLELLTFDHERMLREMEALFEKGQESEFDIDHKRKEIEQLQQEALFKEVERLMKEEMERDLESQFPLSVDHLDLTLTVEEGEAIVSKLVVVVTAREEEEQNFDGTTVRPVEPVVIQVNEEQESPEANKKPSHAERKIQEEVLTYFDWKWNISVDKIDLSWLGR
ncbi:stage III sporulation protein AF [Caldalkalibacillus thermarum TA2.A1]|uniref:Stage III sporulation protein AF n=1 Tax=Caldalkalibacillus thermarum (strain TA2.A1) TaxID=986075 RepID=A0A8X8L970_CALTT|nr:stage III sporulation protein AF [Caldalkalibacillus thermarum]QZT32648.1 stage III sporulation protein AF [Caldalkalibacillus thermarum TA2.A1]